MNQRPLPKHKPKPKKHSHPAIRWFIGGVLIVGILFSIFKIVNEHKTSAILEIKSGIIGYCLDDHHDGNTNNTIIDSWKCNGTGAQEWMAHNDVIQHGTNNCLSVANNGRSIGDKIVLSSCNNGLNQVWMSAIGGYENPTSALCLAIPNGAVGAQLTLASCDDLTEANEVWLPKTWSKKDVSTEINASCNGTEGQKVACYAAKQWVRWQSGLVSHSTLLNTYSDGNGYEEWCADFVSYIYMQAGYPFAGGERDNWDEYLADNIQNMGFTYHTVAGYIPQAGDIAYFDYPGGHVEIVAVGGAKPIFIYGDSGTTDPTTGNGEMTENTITNDGLEGRVVYYLSPS